MATEPAKLEDSTAIDRSIGEAKRAVWLWIGGCAAFYVIWMFYWAGGAISKDPTLAGPLGDFFGGMVNPAVALAAFYWLAKGVSLQHVELRETRQALQEQADHAKISARIDALSALVDAYTADISTRREHLAFLMQQRVNGQGTFYSVRGRQMNESELQVLVAKLNQGIRTRAQERLLCAAELKVLLSKVRSPVESSEIRSWDTSLADDEESDPELPGRSPYDRPAA